MHWLLSLIIDAGILILIMFFFVTSSKSFASGATQQSGAETLDRFAAAFESVANGSAEVAVAQASISEDHVLVVFGTDASYEMLDTCGWNDDVKKSLKYCDKPNNFCACIYDGGNIDDEPLDCRTADDNGKFLDVYAEPYDDFMANLGSTFDESNKRAHTIIYGNCWSSGVKLKIRTLAIEKDGMYIKISDNACGNRGMGSCKSSCSGSEKENLILSRTCIGTTLPRCCVPS